MTAVLNMPKNKKDNENHNILHITVEGIGFYTNSLTGESGMTIPGLSKFAGVTENTIERLLHTLETATTIKVDLFKQFLNTALYMEVPLDIKIVKDDLCAAVVEYFAFDAKTRTDTAAYAFRRFAAKGMRQAIQQQTGYIQPPVVSEKIVPKTIADYYIAEEYRPWEASFPEEFFRNLYRLRGWDYSLRKENKPYVVGRYINFLVYSRLPSGVLASLKEHNPVNDKGYRPFRYHQMVSEGQGKQHLERQIITVVSLMKASETWAQFMEMLDRVTPKTGDEPGEIAPLE